MGVLQQYTFTLLLLLRLKSWRVLVVVASMACLLGNLYIYPAIYGLLTQNTASFLGLSEVGAKDLAASGKIFISNSTIEQKLKQIAESRGVDPNSNQWLFGCASDTDCKVQYLRRMQSLLGNDMLASVRMDANWTIECSLSTSSELDCPFMMQMIYEASSSGGAFRNSKSMILISQEDQEFIPRVTVEPSSPMMMRNSICSPSTLASLYPIVLMIHLIVAISGVILYIIVAQLAPISNFKSASFLQLMVRNGLSVGSYWAAVWTIAIIETIILSAAFTLSIYVQCPDAFNFEKMVFVFLAILLLCLYSVSIAHLCTVLLQSYFIILLVMVLLNVVTMTLLLLSRFLFSVQPNTHIYRDISLAIIPSGHIGEFISSVLLTADLSQLSGYRIAIPIVTAATTVIVTILTIYLDFLVANGNGLRLPVLFLFQPGFWLSDYNKSIDVAQQQQQQQQQQANIESVPDNVKAAIAVKNLTKIYRSRPLPLPCFQPKIVKALNDFSGIIYKDQITALIGHNGAGKTTLIKLLLGDEQANNGLATMGGCELTDPIQRMQLRSSVGVCYQSNVICSYLTVESCIKLALISKGLSIKDNIQEALSLLERLGLADKLNSIATEISGGQQRKLCTLLALIGKPKIIFLDEPTSGLDPVSRRRLWQILQEYKVGRSIVLCTQFMDEADILADRKIFLSGGSLICAGSSLFLKHSFGCGFVFNVSLKSENQCEKLVMELQQHCNSLQLRSQFRTEIESQAPLSEANKVPSILRVLEQKSSIVEAFGLSQATLDEIFMQLKDIDVTKIVEAFQSGQLSTFMNKEHQMALHQQTAAAAGNSNNDLSSQVNLLGNNSLNNNDNGLQISRASKPKQLQALVGMNLLRLRRAKAKLCCRFIFPAVLVLVLVGSVFLETQIDASALPLRRQIRPAIDYGARCICIQDAEDNYKLNETECRLATASTTASSNSIIATKNRSVELNNWLLLSSTLSLFNSTCGGIYAFSRCSFMYSSAWNRTGVSNAQRTVVTGLYRKSKESFLLENSISQQLSLAKASVNYFGSVSNQTQTVFAVTLFTGAFYPLIGCIVLLILLSIVPVTYISDPVEDRETRVRQQLGSMGMSTISYWLNTFLLHWVQYIIFVIAAAIAFCAILPSRYANAYFLAGVILPLLIIGLASNQLSAYTIGSLLKRPNPLITVLYFFFVLFLSIGVQLAQLNSTVSLVMIWCLPPFGAVAIAWFAIKLALYCITFMEVSDFSEVPGGLLNQYFHNPYILHCLIATAVHIIILCFVIWLRESWNDISSGSCKSQRVGSDQAKSKEASAGRTIDIGVMQEEERLIQEIRNEENSVEVRQLKKVYPSGVRAVRGVSFGPKSGEIFGLLGPNGAGKTTTLSIVVGEEFASDGSCEVNFHGKWMGGSEGASNGAVGYCPQHNPLFDDVTTKEHLDFYAKIRGVPPALAKTQVRDLINGLKLTEHSGKQAHQLSGGNKRRLCLAISLLGNPSVVVIDEASTGVDPEAKRFIWQAIRSMAQDNRALVITTHSMEEVEALCSRVGIMNHGQMIGFGSVQQLRSRYGNAYTLDILVQHSENASDEELQQKKQKIVESVMQKFANTQLVEDLYTRLQFLVQQSAVQSGLSAAVQWLLDSTDDLNISYSSFYQMSLDQVFVRLIKRQEEEEEEEERDCGRNANVGERNAVGFKIDNGAFAPAAN